MRTRLLSGLTAAALAAALSLPSAGLANKGHHRGSTRTCPAHHHSGKHKGTRGKRKGSTRGKKCR